MDFNIKVDGSGQGASNSTYFTFLRGGGRGGEGGEGRGGGGVEEWG